MYRRLPVIFIVLGLLLFYAIPAGAIETKTAVDSVSPNTSDNILTATSVPVAQFTASPTSGRVPLTVKFTDLSTNTPTSWKWEYMKSSGTWTQFSTAKSPSYTFKTAGSYSIQLTAKNSGGNNAVTKTDYIVVSEVPVPVAQFTASTTSGRVPLTVKFTDQSSNTPTSWKWEYKKSSGTWTQFSTSQNPSLTFNSADNFDIRLTAKNNGGNDTEEKLDYITVSTDPAPVAQFTASPTSGKAPLAVKFTDLSTNTPTSWKWEYKKRSGSWIQFSTAQNPSNTFNSADTYDIQLTVTNKGGSNSASRIDYIEVSAVQIGSIDVVSSPSGAKVYLDSAYMGTTPYTIKNVKLGSHKVQISKTGYADYIRMVTVTSDSTASVSADLATMVTSSFTATPTVNPRTSYLTPSPTPTSKGSDTSATNGLFILIIIIFLLVVGYFLIQFRFSPLPVSPQEDTFTISGSAPMGESVAISDIDFSNSTCFQDMAQPVTHYCPVTKNAYCADCASPYSLSYPCNLCKESCKGEIISIIKGG